MKKLIIALCIFATAPAAYAQRIKIDYVIADQMGGSKAKAPKWIERISDTETLRKEFPGKYIFALERSGPDKNALSVLLNRAEVGAMVARQISRKAKETIAVSDSGSDADLQNSLDSLLRGVSDAHVPGMQLERSWWYEKEYTKGTRKGQREFVYFVLYSIDKPSLDKLIASEMAKALGGQGKPAQDRLQAVVNQALAGEGN